MKLFLFIAAFFCIATLSFAWEEEAPIFNYGTPVSTDISTSTWTRVPSSNLTGRAGFFITNKSTNTANMFGHFGSSTTPTLATSVRPIVFKAGITMYIPASSDVVIWLLSGASSSETVDVQEVKQ